VNFLEIRQRIAEEMGIASNDTTTDPNATVENKLKEWVNSRYRVLSGKKSWNWLIADSIIQTETEITTGTVSITQDSASITFSSGPTNSVTDWWIQFDDTDDWYFISAHTAASTSATLTSVFLGPTNGTSGYTLRKVYYALPTTVHKILNIRQTRDDRTVDYITPRKFDRFVADRTRSGEPEFYTITGLDSNNQYRMEFYPVPDVRMNLTMRAYKIATEMSADSDTPLIPPQFHEFLVWDVLATYGYLFLDDDRIVRALGIANQLLKDMKANEVTTERISTRVPFDIEILDGNRLDRLDLPVTEV